MNTNKFEKLQQINWLIAEMDSLYHQASLKIGLSDSAAKILYALYINNGSCLLNFIYKDSGISKQTVNSALRKLEDEGVVTLEKQHGKAKMVILTDLGKKKANETVSRIVDAEIGAFESWSKGEIDAYIFLTKKYTETFRKQVNKL